MRLIDIKRLTFEYFRRDSDGNVDEAVEALSDVTLNVKAGDFVAILGANGSGKSTLAKHINALLLPESGEVIVDGMDIEDEEVRLSIRKTVGMVFQNPDNQLVANIVEEDVAFGPENIGIPSDEIFCRVDEGLEAVSMSEYREKSPEHLSGGQKQRVAIAGVLAMRPKCVIFDEATSMLDPQGRAKVIEIATRLREEGITVIFITHHVEEVVNADRIFVMREGNIVLEGTPSEVFREADRLFSCGLELPPLNRYIDYLIDSEIVTRHEVRDVRDVNALVLLLLNKYSDKVEYINNIDDEDITLLEEFAPEEDSEEDEEDVGHRLPSEDELRNGIFLNNISFTYNKGYTEESIALKNVTLSVGKGEFLAVIGHTGSGKSTLIQHMNGLNLPTEGSVYYNGQDISDKDFDRKSLRQKVGLVFQYPESQLFAETVEQDVCFGPQNMNLSKVEAQKRAYEAIALVGLPDTIYDCSPFQLSGGQKRRVAIAGVLAMQPDYLILDEPTAGLDPKAASELMKMLKRLQEQKGIGIVIVSHSMEEVAEYADRVVVLERGQIRYDGEVCEVFSMEEDLKRMGLDIPIGISILRRLRQVGFDVDIRKYRVGDICRELLRVRY